MAPLALALALVPSSDRSVSEEKASAESVRERRKEGRKEGGDVLVCLLKGIGICERRRREVKRERRRRLGWAD